MRFKINAQSQLGMDFSVGTTFSFNFQVLTEFHVLGTVNNDDSKLVTARMDGITVVLGVMLMMLMHSYFGIVNMLVHFVSLPLIYCYVVRFGVSFELAILFSVSFNICFVLLFCGLNTIIIESLLLIICGCMTTAEKIRI